MKHYLLAGLLLASVPTLAQTAPAAGAPPSLLASAVVAGLVSAVVSGGIALLVKDREYKNDYYKKVIDKRIKAIEAVEAFTSLFTAATRDDKGDLYLSFFRDDNYEEVFKESIVSLSKGDIWLSKKTQNAAKTLTQTLSSILKKCHNKPKPERIKIAVDKFDTIHDQRVEIEGLIRKDMASLHKVDDFFKYY